MKVANTRIRLREPMHLHTALHIGGPAEIWAEPADIQALAELLQAADPAAVPVTFVGGGANLLVRDEGIPGLTIHLGHRNFAFCRKTVSGLQAGAGLPLEWLIRNAQQAGLSGVEFLAGVPGRVGGAVRMNAGTRTDSGQMRSMADVVTSVQVMDRTGRLERLTTEAVGFGYRSSRLSDRIVLEADFTLAPDDPECIQDRVRKLWAVKRRTQDWTAPSSGCIFKNPPGEKSAGWLIDQAGFKGMRVGGVAISGIHANFMMNVDRGSAQDVLTLIGRVQTKVRDQFGVTLETEVRIIPEGENNESS